MRYVLLICALLTMSATAQASKVKTSEDLIREMQKKHAKSWYKTLTFVQKTTEYHQDGTSKVSTWYEAFSAPGKLRIDFDPVKDGNGILFANFMLYSFKEGKVVNSRPFVHPLLLLGFDVYFLPVEEVMAKLTQLKFDLSQFREDVWQGKPAYVVGAKAGDLHSRQFWIDKKNLYFVRLIEPGGKDGSLTQETQFNKYERVRGGGWVAPEVIFMVNGKPVITEEYTEIRGGVALDEKLFDPQHWSTTHWR
jgi:outer membrane lipoprotein-sorting protein